MCTWIVASWSGTHCQVHEHATEEKKLFIRTTDTRTNELPCIQFFFNLPILAHPSRSLTTILSVEIRDAIETFVAIPSRNGFSSMDSQGGSEQTIFG